MIFFKQCCIKFANIKVFSIHLYDVGTANSTDILKFLLGINVGKKIFLSVFKLCSTCERVK